MLINTFVHITIQKQFVKCLLLKINLKINVSF